MPDWLTNLLIVAALVVAWTLVDLLFPCRCGRSLRWYYDRHHEAGGVMLIRAGWFAVATVADVLAFDRIYALLWAVATVYYARRWWLHEKDRLRRWAARVAGRVVIDAQRRRLKVEQTTGATS